MTRAFNPAARAACEAAAKHHNGIAFTRVIRHGESYQDDRAWTVRWGGTGKPPKVFDDLSKHPRIFEPGPNGPSSAAGFAQITATTFDDIAPLIGVTSFYPADQVLLAFAICWVEGALGDIIDGRLEQAIEKLGGRWASFPSSLSGQPSKKLAELKKVFVEYGGALADSQSAAPIEERDVSGAPPRAEEPSFMDNVKSTFGGIAAAAGPALTAGAPLAGAFNPGLGLALGLAGKLLEMFEPLAREKATKELSRHTDPAVAAKIADNMINKARELSGLADPVLAVSSVMQDPAKVALVQADVLDDLERMAPMLERIHAQQKDEWTAEEASRDAAAVRAKAEPWDMTKVLVLSMLVMVGLSAVFLFALASYQAVSLASKEPTALVWSSIVYMLGVITGIWLTVIAYRFGSSRSSAAKDVQINELSRRAGGR